MTMCNIKGVVCIDQPIEDYPQPPLLNVALSIFQLIVLVFTSCNFNVSVQFRRSH